MRFEGPEALAEPKNWKAAASIILGLVSCALWSMPCAVVALTSILPIDERLATSSLFFWPWMVTTTLAVVLGIGGLAQVRSWSSLARKRATGGLFAAAASCVGAGLVPAVVHSMMESSFRMHSAKRVKNLALSMHDFHSGFDRLPPCAIYSDDGKPLLSWRVLLLPYLGENDLFTQFKLNEPWDSPNNLPLLYKMPRMYESRSILRRGIARTHLTRFQVFVGPGAIFEGRKRRTLGQITARDGTSNTLLIVEAGDPVPWTKPEDLVFDVEKPLPDLTSPYPNGFFVSFADGSSGLIDKRIPDDVLRSLITWSGGETIPTGEWVD